MKNDEIEDRDGSGPLILWFRRDLRIADHPALHAACETGRPIIPVFIHEEMTGDMGAAARFRLSAGLEVFTESLKTVGSRLILRKGKALEVLQALIEETGADAVWWSRLYDEPTRDRDTKVKSALREAGIDARSFAGHVLFEPWEVETKTGGFYKVYTPMWKAVRDREVGPALPAPKKIAAPGDWPKSDDLAKWTMEAEMRRGAAVLAPHMHPGEAVAHERLAAFMHDRVVDYRKARDFPGMDGTSGMSEHLTYGEISARQCWHAGKDALHASKNGAEVFLKELVWREFAYHLVYHTPRITHANWREEWDDFPWQTDADHPDVIAWKQGRTGVPFVDAAMRQLYVTGVMHNRGRMIVASYLCKHLMTHWKIGCDWFAEHLIDWDPASNAMGWQWAAGSGPDAAPYFRIFNPETQLEKFDKAGDYPKAWIAEGQKSPPDTALSYFDAVPGRWKLSADDLYPDPVVDLAEGRKRALAAYEAR